MDWNKTWNQISISDHIFLPKNSQDRENSGNIRTKNLVHFKQNSEDVWMDGLVSNFLSTQKSKFSPEGRIYVWLCWKLVCIEQDSLLYICLGKCYIYGKFHHEFVYFEFCSFYIVLRFASWLLVDFRNHHYMNLLAVTQLC